MNDRECDVTMAFRDWAEGVRDGDDEKEALAFGFVANVASRKGTGGGCWSATAAAGRGRGRGRYASAIASSNIVTASTSQVSGWLMLMMLKVTKSRQLAGVANTGW